jgi:hypothetical protein
MTLIGNMYCQQINNPSKMTPSIENAGLIPKLQAVEMPPTSPLINSPQKGIKASGVGRLLPENNIFTVPNNKDPLSGLLIM